ncbi:MAG: hypothetical protein AVDCRST_MAG53-2705, partial [uncultured Solirubrobacteraceae bacterium]
GDLLRHHATLPGPRRPRPRAPRGARRRRAAGASPGAAGGRNRGRPRAGAPVAYRRRRVVPARATPLVRGRPHARTCGVRARRGLRGRRDGAHPGRDRRGPGGPRRHAGRSSGRARRRHRGRRRPADPAAGGLGELVGALRGARAVAARPCLASACL